MIGPAEKPLVVAMVPACDGDASIEATLASLLAQDHPNLRVLISDDASVDRTGAICEAVAASDDRVILARQPHRLGWIGNSNALLEMLESLPGVEAAFFAPHDDTFAPSYVRELLEALDANPDASLAYADTVKFGDGWSRVATAAWTVRPGGPLRRGLRYVLDVDDDRWTPFRGLVRICALRDAPRLRRSWVGEFEADGRWLFLLHVRGPFVRVPRQLCRKPIYRDSLGARNHAHAGRRGWAMHTLSYHREILAAPQLGPGARATLLFAMAAQAAVHLLPRANTALARVVRRLAP